MALKEIYTKKIEAGKGNVFSISPKSLMNSFQKEGNGIWILLGDISEYFPLVTKRLFDNQNKLEAAINNDKEEITKEIKELENEVEEISKLNSALINIGLNQDLIEIHEQRDLIEAYPIEKLLTEENLKFAQENFESFGRLDNLKKAAEGLDNRITEIIQKTTQLGSFLRENLRVLTPLLTDIAGLKSEIIDPLTEIDLKVKALGRDELINLRDQREREIKTLERVRAITKTRRDAQLSAFNAAKALTPSLKQTKESMASNFEEAKKSLKERTDLDFDTLLTLGDISDDIVDSAKNEFEQHKRIYEMEFLAVAGSFEESKQEKKNPELYNLDGTSNFSYQTLENVLCGKIGLDGLTNELNGLNTSLVTLGNLQLKILTEVFGLVEKQYKSHQDTIRRLNFFFEKNMVSDTYKFRVEFEPRKDINIDWIEKMKARSRVHKNGIDLFTHPDDLPSNDNTPENLIKNIAKTFYSSVNADTSLLLNPKFYFTLKVKMEDAQGKGNSGSGGQAYTALALLCIGRLSIVQRHQENNIGIKFIIIEELSNIDDTNFNIFPEIAREFGYQLLTMTPKPFGSYTNENWYLHMLVKGKEEKDRNYTPMSFFKTKFKKIDLRNYIESKNELEGIKTT